MSYTKLANSILTSTVWMEDDQTRIVWLTLLAMADKNGEVQASIPGLANVARVSVESCERALTTFLSPDHYSRTKTEGGRRIQEIRGGWHLINHDEYRRLASEEDRKEKAAIRQARKRELQRKASLDVTHLSRTCHAFSPNVTHPSRQKTQAEAEADTKAEAELKPPTPFPTPAPQGGDLLLAAPMEPRQPPRPSELQIRLGALFRRRPDTRWSQKEIKALKAIGNPDEDDLRRLEAYYSARLPRDGDYRRTTLLVLLNNFSGELDRARNFKSPSCF